MIADNLPLAIRGAVSLQINMHGETANENIYISVKNQYGYKMMSTSGKFNIRQFLVYGQCVFLDFDDPQDFWLNTEVKKHE